MYNQSIQNMKVVILSLDGVMFDLNRYRYNYCNHLYNKKNRSLDKHLFYSQLSNMYDMYKNILSYQNNDVGLFNARIERELSEYLHYKGLKPKEGLLEFIEYLHQKHKNIAVISTHRTKDAVEYLKLANLYNKVHFIIGSDTSSLPLPSSQMLETVCEHFHVDPSETVVISSFLTLNKAAQNIHMNVIYCEDLVHADEEEKNTSLKITHNLFEVLNTFLFDKYIDPQIYAPILGMDDKMSKKELKNKYDHLKETYLNDKEVLNVIEQTYQYQVQHLNEQIPNKQDTATMTKKDSPKQQKRFQFIDEDNDLPKKRSQTVLKQEAPIKQNQEEEKSPSLSIDQDEEQKLMDLLQQIKTKEQKKEPIQEETTVETEEENILLEEKSIPFLDFLSDMLYVLSLSFLILFGGIIFRVIFIHQFEAPEGIFQFITLLFQGYYQIVEGLFKICFDTLHSFISFIPSYTTYCQSATTFSLEGIQFLNIFIFNSIVIIIVKLIISMIQRRKHAQNDKND